KLDSLTTTALAVLLLLIGQQLKRRIAVLEQFCIPAPVIGGFVMSLIILALRQTSTAQISFDTAMQAPLMVAFFTTVGIGGSLALLSKGGSALIIYLLICWALAVFQNTFGAGIAFLFGIDPLLGVMAGGVSLEGGHGAAAAFGPLVQNMGHAGATTVALSSATFGLIAGGLIGGPVANYLIKRHKVKIESVQSDSDITVNHDHGGYDGHDHISSEGLIGSLGLILVLMVAGIAIAKLFEQSMAFVLPSYVGAMFAAIIFRNINDFTHWIKLNQQAINALSDIALGVFLTMAMMSLKIWELYDLALPLVSILLFQVAALVAIAIFIAFPLLGKNYDAAVMCAGLVGHGLGATPNAVANMSALSQRYGVVSYKAFLIIPLCGAVLIDIVAIPFHTWIINVCKTIM
ncbi:MAG: sodium/glutamate symporter, partial [Glaciimonas sp.]|nr:sodium/glutamate symporter [Glaciimonas sp.]